MSLTRWMLCGLHIDASTAPQASAAVRLRTLPGLSQAHRGSLPLSLLGQQAVKLLAEHTEAVLGPFPLPQFEEPCILPSPFPFAQRRKIPPAMWGTTSVVIQVAGNECRGCRVFAKLERGLACQVKITIERLILHVARIFACWPVEEIRLVDPPELTSLGTDGSGATTGPWQFQRQGLELSDQFRRAISPFRQPSDDWTRVATGLREALMQGLDTRDFAGRDAAHLALSQTCVNFGRELVGLPILSGPDA